MKKSIRIFVVIISAALFAVSAVNAALALSTADAKEPIDTTKKCSLSLTYAIEEKKIEGIEIAVYQAADVTKDFKYSMTGAFSGYSIEINGIKAQSEWDEVVSTVGAYIVADGIAPTAKKTTDANGVVSFADLPAGIYYVSRTGNDTTGNVMGFPPFMIAVPSLSDEGKWIYDVSAFAKPGTLPEQEPGEMTIVKLWNDGAKSSERPGSVSVDIFKNGITYDSVVLTEEMNWTYTWETDGEYVWTAVERDVPSGYTVSVQNLDGNTIRLTNTRGNEEPPAPPTGDTSDFSLWIVLMILSGIALIAFGGRGKAENED